MISFNRLLRSIDAVIALPDEIREHVNQRRTHSSLFADTPRFNRACSAMDMLGDTGQALRSYIHQCERPVELGLSYVLVFGHCRCCSEVRLLA